MSETQISENLLIYSAFYVSSSANNNKTIISTLFYKKDQCAISKRFNTATELFRFNMIIEPNH